MITEAGAAALEYHERTKHSYDSVRSAARPLDWINRPHPFKEYVGIEPLPLPDELARLLGLGAGVVRTRRYPDEFHFRTYSSAGALYPVEVYVARPDGLYHFHPRELALRRLRPDGVRGNLARAAAAPRLAEAAAVLCLTGILWRTAWKYGARGYRHLWWDAGTMLASLLAVCADEDREAAVFTGFVDAEVNVLLGVDGEREGALALLAVGWGERAREAADVAPLELEVAPLSPREMPFPEVYAVHAASACADPAEVVRYRGGVEPHGSPGPSYPDVEKVLRRRGSIRDFRDEPASADSALAVFGEAAEPIPADVPPSNGLVFVANRVDGWEPGAYRFRPPGSVELLRAGDVRLQAGYLVLEQPLGALSAATLFFTADLPRVVAERGDRGYRAAHLEAGIRTGRVYLGAVSRGLGATASTFYDDDVSRFFETDESPLLAAAVGQR